MRNKAIQNVLEEFDNIIQELHSKDDPIVTEQLNRFEVDFNLISQWRDEIESEKQSVYVIGKTSTGKSKFHNYLLEGDNVEIYKTSTKVETGVIQTLQHIKEKGNAVAHIIVKNIDEFEKLAGLNLKEFNNLKFDKATSTRTLPLNIKENIEFLREVIMAAPETSCDENYHPAKAISKIDIFYPMKIFQNFIFIDTPGLGSHISATNETVRAFIKGKSHVFWILKGSEKSMSDSLSLIKREEKLLEDNSVRHRMVFFANQFDMIDIEEEINNLKPDEFPGKKKSEIKKIIREKNKSEMTILINDSLNKIMKLKDYKSRILFTSFLHPATPLGKSTTDENMKALQEQLSENIYNRDIDNISSLVDLLCSVLGKINRNVVENIRKRIAKEVEDQHMEKKEIDKKRYKASKLKSDVEYAFKMSMETLSTIDSTLKKSNNRDLYEGTVKNFNKGLSKIYLERYRYLLDGPFRNIPLSSATKTIVERLNTRQVSAHFNTKKPFWFFSTDKELKEKIKMLTNKIEAQRKTND